MIKYYCDKCGKGLNTNEFSFDVELPLKNRITKRVVLLCQSCFDALKAWLCEEK